MKKKYIIFDICGRIDEEKIFLFANKTLHFKGVFVLQP